MINKSAVISEIDSLNGVKTLVTAYQEIAANKIRRSRATVLKKRDFVDEISDIFQEVKSSYINEMSLVLKNKRASAHEKLSLIKRNGKTVYILLSANTGLYGDILAKTHRLFAETISKSQGDIIIVGRVGEEVFVREFPNVPYTFFNMPDGNIDPVVLSQILQKIVQYEKAYVFHGKFENVISQIPTLFDLTGDIETDKEPVAKPTIKYFFEPSLEKILIFFEEQIVAAIFEQSLHESSLSKFSSRMVTLDRAIENIRGQLKKVELQKRLITHQTANKKQLDSLVSMALWNK